MANLSLNNAVPNEDPKLVVKSRGIAIVQEWLAGQNAPQHLINRATDLLDEDALRAQPELLGLVWPDGGMYGHISGAHWQYKVRQEIAHVLGWTAQQPAGALDGFPPAFNRWLKEVMWPDVPASTDAVNPEAQ